MLLAGKKKYVRIADWYAPSNDPITKTLLHKQLRDTFSASADPFSFFLKIITMSLGFKLTT